MGKVLPLMLLVAALAATADESGSRDGQVRSLTEGGFVAWDVANGEWLTPLEFWQNFAGRARGREWPSSSDYPPYDSVNEHDTFLVQTADGPCLMYFFHTRWRRANDVWRWGDAFNRYGGCSTVFD